MNFPLYIWSSSVGFAEGEAQLWAITDAVFVDCYQNNTELLGVSLL